MKRSYYAIIPGNVRYDKSLTPNAKLLYGEITALCNEKGYCWAGDSYFTELYGVSRSTVQRWFSQLERKGYIKREVKYKEGTRKIEHRYTYLCYNPIPKNETTPIPKNETDNNTVINNTSNNTINSYIVEIVGYLNRAANKNFRSSTSKTKTLIKARYKEGFSLEDFKKVIDTKVREWKNDKNMNKFLRPETLFGTKFESYLNQDVKGDNCDSQYDNLF